MKSALVVLLLLGLAFSLSLSAAPVCMTGSGTGSGGESLSDSACFKVGGGNLTLVLTNNQMAGTGYLANFLSGVFWNISLSDVFLAPLSATAEYVIDAENSIIASAANVGGYWGFAEGSLLGGRRNGVGGAGLGYFGPHNLFIPCQACGEPDGANYTIAGRAGVVPGSDGIPNQGPYTTNYVTFVWALSGANAGSFDPSLHIRELAFVHGTGPEYVIRGEVAEPATITLFLLGIGLLSLRLGWRTKEIRQP